MRQPRGKYAAGGQHKLAQEKTDKHTKINNPRKEIIEETVALLVKEICIYTHFMILIVPLR